MANTPNAFVISQNRRFLGLVRFGAGPPCQTFRRMALFSQARMYDFLPHCVRTVRYQEACVILHLFSPQYHMHGCVKWESGTMDQFFLEAVLCLLKEARRSPGSIFDYVPGFTLFLFKKNNLKNQQLPCCQ